MPKGPAWGQAILDKVLAAGGRIEGDRVIQSGPKPSFPIAAATRAPAPTRHRPPATEGMNKLEARYAREVLDIRQMGGEIKGWKFGAINLRLAKRTYYKPDFLVELPEGRIEIHETKGFWEDDARVKFKVAAEMFREFRFIAIQYKRGHGWVYEEMD